MISAGVIGWPVAHSKSPLIHRFWLEALGIDGDYGRFPVAPERLGDAIRALPALGLRGVNVTVPHKIAVLAYLETVDPLAALAGAVNTIVVDVADKLTGYNTDIAGFRAPLFDLLATLPSGQQPITMTLIGTGGAARAVAAALHQGQWTVSVYGRDVGKAEALAQRLNPYTEPQAFDLNMLSAPDHTEFAPVVAHGHVIINATTLGMIGQPPLAIDLAPYPDDTIVYDLVYTPLETPLLAAARARGMRAVDGLSMLIGQAAAAFELFFGAKPPRERDAELRALLLR